MGPSLPPRCCFTSPCSYGPCPLLLSLFPLGFPILGFLLSNPNSISPSSGRKLRFPNSEYPSLGPKVVFSNSTFPLGWKVGFPNSISPSLGRKFRFRDSKSPSLGRDLWLFCLDFWLWAFGLHSLPRQHAIADTTITTAKTMKTVPNDPSEWWPDSGGGCFETG